MENIKEKNFNSVICGLATTFIRKNSLKETVLSIINQVDELIVYQNDYYEVLDFLKHDKIRVVSGIITGIDMGDAGKFFLVEQYPNSYYLSIDDDIIYPENYVKSIIEGLEKYNNKVVVSHHGRLYGKNAKNYYTDASNVYHFKKQNDGYRKVDFAGTGVMGFHTSQISIKFSDFIYPNMADVIVGVKMKKLGVDLICLPHPPDWLKDTNLTDLDNRLFVENKSSDIFEKFLNENFFSKSNPQISVVIPTFNTCEFLSECINSVVMSMNKIECEVLVGIDNCEKTLSYIKNNEFDSRIRFFYFEKNVGPYVVKNSLVKICNSDVVLFFDSDDIMKDNMIPTILDKMKSNDFVKPMYTNFEHTTYNINISQTKSQYFGEGVFSIKKSLFLQMNGFENWRCAADTDFMTRLYKNSKKFSYTNQVVFFRRIHQNNLTTNPETNFRSTLRKDYYNITKNRKYFGPLSELKIEKFLEVYPKGYSNIIREINYTKSQEIEEKERSEVISKLTLKRQVLKPIIQEVKTHSPDKKEYVTIDNTPQVSNLLSRRFGNNSNYVVEQKTLVQTEQPKNNTTIQKPISRSINDIQKNLINQKRMELNNQQKKIVPDGFKTKTPVKKGNMNRRGGSFDF